MSKRALVAIAGMMAVALAVVIGVAVYVLHVRESQTVAFPTPSPQPNSPSQPPQTQPTSSGTPRIVKPGPHFEKTYMDVIRASFPSVPTSRLAVPLELGQAARFILRDPIFLSKARGDLWITRPDAPPIDQVLRDAVDPQAEDPASHVLRERVAYVHWMPSESGPWQPCVICRTEHGYEAIWGKNRKALPAQRDFDWERAFPWYDAIVAPSATGVSIFHFGSQITESYQQVIQNGSGKTGRVEALLDTQGVLAWAPWEHETGGSRGAWRYVDGKWSVLGPEQGWPQKITYLVPLHDGSVFQFIQAPGESITVQSVSLDSPAIDERAIRKLIAQLNNPEQDVRQKAFVDLANCGPGAWPVLEKLMNGQPPQARVLLAQLLKDKTHPSLSGMTLLGNRKLSLVSRLSDGGIIFYADQGVSVPESDDQTSTTTPAWLSIRPGHFIELLPATLLVDLKPDACSLDVVADQWIVTSDTRGPRLFYGNGTATLLRKDELEFTRLVGMDQVGRWLFRKPAVRDEQPMETLIIDPHLADPTPRLPAWQLAIAQTVGWDKDNWPIVQNGSAFALMESDWRGMDKDEKIYSRTDEIPPTTTTTTQPTSAPTTTIADLPLLITRDGTRYYGGLTELRVVEATGEQITWPLPDIATGLGKPWLVRDRNGKLFLFNQPGRILRIARTPGGPQPFKIEATFTHNIPNTSTPTRIWLDPAGRIDIEWGNRLAILFPDGYIPRPIMEKIVDRSGLDAEGL